MGVSFMGLATKETNKEKVISSLVDTFKIGNRKYDVILKEELSFGEIINRKPDNVTLDIYKSDSGILLTMSHELFEEYLNKEALSENFDFVYFDISDTSNSYRFALFNKGKEGQCMNIWDLGDSTKRIAGDNFLGITNEEDVFYHSFPRAVDSYLPNHFHKIDLASKVDRYKLILNSTPTVTINNKDIYNKKLKEMSFWKRLFQ
jgi:hypothetical protein